MKFIKFLVVSAILALTTSFAHAAGGECHSGYMMITVNKDGISTKADILEATRQIFSRTSDVRVTDAYMQGDEVHYVVISREEIKQKKLIPQVREVIAQKYRAIPGVEVDTCHHPQEVSITGSN